MVKVLAWNIARRDEAWRYLLDADADMALLQEATAPPADVARRLEVDPSPWRTAGAGEHRPWRAAVVKLSSRVQVQWIEPESPDAIQRHPSARLRVRLHRVGRAGACACAERA